MHYATLQNLYGVDEVLEAYNQGDADFHTIVADMAEIPRDQAKTINLGLFYGMGKINYKQNSVYQKIKLMIYLDNIITKYHS